MLTLLPELADFDLPPKRDPKDLWVGDMTLLEAILNETTPDKTANQSFACVAVDMTPDVEKVLGLIIVTMRDELMSHAPSAHLEAIVVHADARGIGLGRKLLAEAESRAKARDAQSLSLHVFARNERALTLYKAQGFDPELIRAIKWFD